MPVAFASKGTGNRATGSSTTLSTSWTHTITTSGTDCIVIVGVVSSISTSAADTSATVTYGGVAMTQTLSAQIGSLSNRGFSALYILRNPPTGAKTVVVTSTGTGTKTAIAGQSAAYTGVGDWQNNGAATTTGITSSYLRSGGRVFAVVGNGAALSAPNQTSLYSAGSLVTGLNDYISVQDGAAAAFTNSGTATTPSALAVTLHPVGVKMETFTDNFAIKDTSKWNWQTAQPTIVGGQLQFLSTVAGAVDYIYTSGPTYYDLTGSYFVIEVASLPLHPGGGYFTFEPTLELAEFSTYTLKFVVTADASTKLIRAEEQSSTLGIVKSTEVAFTAAHRWLRMRESAGTVYWDTSPDGITWTNFWTRPNGPVFTGALSVDLLSRNVTAASTQPSIFDNLNIIPTLTAPANTGSFFGMF